MNRWSTDDFYGSENPLYGTIILDTCALYVCPNMQSGSTRRAVCKLWIGGDYEAGSSVVASAPV